MKHILLTAFVIISAQSFAIHAGTLKLDSYGLGFGDVQIGETIVGDLITITNSGTATTLVLPLQVTGADASHFFIVAQPSMATLNDGQSVTFRVAFRPTAVGSRTATVFIQSNGTQPSIETIFTGNGISPAPQPQPLTSAFTYQGKLTDGGHPANGTYDLTFRLWDMQSLGAQIGAEVPKDDVIVTAGVFTVTLDFGDSPFTTGTGNYLEISVRPGASSGGYTLLSPRQPITAAPYAVQTLRAESAVTADNSNALGGMPPSVFVQTTDPRLSDAREPQAGSGNYIQNTTIPQVVSNFNISGTGRASTALIGNVVDATTQFNLGGQRFLDGDPDAFNALFFGGFGAGISNTGGHGNSFVGHNAGRNNTNGFQNTFVGSQAGRAMVTGGRNSFYGQGAGTNNTAGADNSFFGDTAGWNGGGSFNSFFGVSSGSFTNGNRNSFFGTGSGITNTTGFANTLLGSNTDVAFPDLSFGTAIGAFATVDTSDTIVLGKVSGNYGTPAVPRPADLVRVPGNFRVSGNFGLGLPTANFRFHVKADGQDGIKIQHTGTGEYPQIRWTDSNDVFKASIGVGPVGTEGIHLFVNGSDRMIIEPSGLIRMPGGIFIANPNTLVITSQNGACWGITVSNAGALSTFPVACP